MRERKFYLILNAGWLLALALLAACACWWLLAVLLLAYPFVFDRSREPFLPVLMYHCVNDRYQDFIYSNICVSRRNFRWAMAWLSLRGHRTLNSGEAEAFTRGTSFGRRIVHLTFDDGYLDNWVNVAPILQAKGQRGTVYVSRDFIRQEGAARPQRTREDQPELEDWGFMNREEIRRAQAAGVLEFLPHGRSHTWYEHADRLLGFHLPGDQMAWLDWNLQPEAKADWIRDFPQGFAPAGWPVLEHRKSLEARRFIVDQELLHSFTASLAELAPPWTAAALHERWQAFRREHPVIGRPESDEEYEARLWDELTCTKDWLRRELGVESPHFCWPGGGKEPRSLELAHGPAGYSMSTIHQEATPNRRGVPDRWLYRVGAGNSLRFENPVYNLLRFIGHVETYGRNYCFISLFALTEGVEWLAARLGRSRRAGDNRAPRLGLPLDA